MGGFAQWYGYRGDYPLKKANNLAAQVSSPSRVSESSEKIVV